MPEHESYLGEDGGFTFSIALIPDAGLLNLKKFQNSIDEANVVPYRPIASTDKERSQERDQSPGVRLHRTRRGDQDVFVHITTEERTEPNESRRERRVTKKAPLVMGLLLSLLTVALIGFGLIKRESSQSEINAFIEGYQRQTKSELSGALSEAANITSSINRMQSDLTAVRAQKTPSPQMDPQNVTIVQAIRQADSQREQHLIPIETGLSDMRSKVDYLQNQINSITIKVDRNSSDLQFKILELFKPKELEVSIETITALGTFICTFLSLLLAVGRDAKKQKDEI